MQLARVAGTVVSTRKEQRIEGIKFLLLEKIDAATMAVSYTHLRAHET